MSDDQAATVVQWEVQRYERHCQVWMGGLYGRTDTQVDLHALGMAALAAYLVSVDRARDLVDRRVVVRRGDGPESTAVTEDDLQAHLHDHRYYDTLPRPPLREVLEDAAVEALPAYLRKELDQPLGG
jgi:hypothetical protein